MANPDEDNMDDHDDEGEEDLGDENGEGDEDEEDNPLLHLPEYVLKRVAKLQSLQGQHEKMMEEYLAERAALEKKYEARAEPLYTQRAVIIRGDKDAEIAQEAGDGGGEQQGDIRGIPQFWACAMGQMETIGELITEEDVDCLEYIEDIRCVDREDGKGFSLFFHFAPNEYFTNTVLKKEYEVPNMLISDEPLLKNVLGTPIDWKEGKSLTHRDVKKKQRGKGKNAGQVRTVTKTEPKESFFNWFTPPEMPPMDQLDEEEAEALEELFDSDYEVAQAFRLHLIPRAIMWFSGQGEEEEVEVPLEAMVLNERE